MLDFPGGKVKRTPPRVLTPTKLADDADRNLENKNIKNFNVPDRTKLEELVDDAVNERDRIIGNLLDLDNKFDMLQGAIDDQLKDMNIPVNNRGLRKAVRDFGGDGNNITFPIYKKAKKISEAIPTALGVNPIHIPFAKNTPFGKALTQYSGDILKNCADIDPDNFPNKTLVKEQKKQPFIPSKTNSYDDDGIGVAGKNEDNSLLTTIGDLLNKAKVDMLNYLQWTLFWDVIYHKFLKVLILFHPKAYAKVLKPWVKKKIIGRFIAEIYCRLIKLIYFFENIPEILGLRPPPINGNKQITKKLTDTNDGDKDLSFKYYDGSREEQKSKNQADPNEKPYVNEGIQSTNSQINDCLEDEEMKNARNSNKINRDDSSEDRKGKLVQKMKKCFFENNYKFFTDEESKPEQDDKSDCEDGVTREYLEEVGNAAGTGIDESVPAQEGFIPPPCYEAAIEILRHVFDDLFNPQSELNYNPSAVIFNHAMTEMRQHHEVSKFMVTIMDDSPGSKALRENTANRADSKHNFMAKEMEDTRDYVLNKQR